MNKLKVRVINLISRVEKVYVILVLNEVFVYFITIFS